MLSAGEASGDRLGAGLALALRRLRPDVELFGMGGEKMEAAGVRLLQESSEISVVGLFEVLAHLPAIRAVMSKLERALIDEQPDLLVPIDFPDFNLRLAARAARAEVPVVYYVGPQVWAWRGGRVHTIRRLVERMLVLFPFEAAFYERASVPVRFVGYPVNEPPSVDRDELCRKIGFDPQRPILALMPGSRSGEVGRQIPTMRRAASQLKSRHPELQFLIPQASGLDRAALDPLADLPDTRVHRGDYPDVLTLCEASIVAAGTATLDCALAGLPSVVIYWMNPMSYRIGKWLVKLDHVALPNLIAGRRVFAELIQAEYTATAVTDEIEAVRPGGSRRPEVLEGLQEIRRRLQSGDAFEAAAREVLDAWDCATFPARPHGAD